jgi:hypothetical protein
MRKIIAGPVIAGLIGLAALAVPAAAAHADEGGSGGTVTTFTVSAGPLTLSTPDSADLGNANIGDPSISASLGAMSVVDQRATTSGSWTASVTSTDFTTGDQTSAETIPAGDVTYDPGSALESSGTATFTAGTPGTLDNTNELTAFQAASEVGAAAVSWNPTITVALPSAVVAGTYTGTITQSVA